MHIDITTTYSLKDDDGREVIRSVSKARCTSFSLDEDINQIDRRVAGAKTRSAAGANAATRAVIEALKA